MRKQDNFMLAVALLLVFPSLAHAQHAPMASVSPSRAVSVAPASLSTAPAAFRTASSSPAMRTSNRIVTDATRAMGSGGGSKSVLNGGSSLHSSNAGFASDPISLQQLLEPFPADGFDFAHLNTMNRDLNAKALIDPATQIRIAEAERRLRHSARASAGSGIYVLDGGGAYAIPDDSPVDGFADDGDAQGRTPSGDDQAPEAEPPPHEQRPIMIIQRPAQSASSESTDSVETPEDTAPLRDVGQFTLVTRDGMEIQAVAFTRVRDKIVYITSEGARYTIALRDLDSEETVRVNQERGTPLQLPL